MIFCKFSSFINSIYTSSKINTILLSFLYNI
nr:MAG TPA: hypothetical protein [Bacteriophage sp.]